MPAVSKPWQPRSSGALRACSGMYWDSFIVPVFNSSLPFRQEPSMEPTPKHSTSPHTLFFNTYFYILTSSKTCSAKCYLPFRCQPNIKRLRLSSVLCLFHVLVSSGPGPPRPGLDPGEEIYSDPSSNGTVLPHDLY